MNNYLFEVKRDDGNGLYFMGLFVSMSDAGQAITEDAKSRGEGAVYTVERVEVTDLENIG